MNTIIAYAGEQPCAEALVQALCSAPPAGLSGMAVKDGETLFTVRTAGNPEALKADFPEAAVSACIGIAGTAEVLCPGCSEAEAPPVIRGKLALFTDSAVPLPQGISAGVHAQNAGEAAMLRFLTAHIGDGIPAALRETAQRYPVHGAVVLGEKENAVFCRAGRSPLFVGIASHGYWLASDLRLLTGNALRFYVLQTGEFAKLTPERVTVYDKRLRRIKKTPLPLESEEADPLPLPSPDSPLAFSMTVRETLARFLKDGAIHSQALHLPRRSAIKIEKIILAGIGDALHTARLAAYNLMLLTDIPARAYAAGELRFSGEPMDKSTLLIALCDDGRDENLLVCLKRAANLGARTLALTPYTKSPVALAADTAVALPGQNAAVAAFLALALMTLAIGSKTEVISEVHLNVALRLADMLPGKVTSAVRNTAAARITAQALCAHNTVIATGIGADEAAAGEAASLLRRNRRSPVWHLPLAELTAEIGSIPEGTLLLCFLTGKETAPQTEYHLRRLLAAGCHVLVLTTEGIEAELFSEIPAVAYPDSIPLFAPLVCLAGLARAIDAAGEAAEQAAG